VKTTCLCLCVHGGRSICGLAAVVLAAVAVTAAAGEWPEPLRAHLQQWASRGHPRLMLDAGQIRAWRDRLNGSHAELWQQVLGQVDRLNGRGDANMMARLAVMAKLADDAELGRVAKRYLLGMCGRKVWDKDRDLLHGHMLWAAAIAYDWLFADLTEPERAEVRSKLAHEAQLQYLASSADRGYWRNQYLQNHGHVNLCGLAFAGAALYGEDERAEAWWGLADDFFANVFKWSNPDGVSVEGLSYGAYALEFCLRYAELARQGLGKDYFGSPWLKNFPLYLVHSSLPVMTKSEWAMTFGDSPRAANSHLPVHSMARIAAEYRDPIAQGFGRLLARLHGKPGRDAWQTVLWFDPAVPAKDRSELPTFHHFADVGQVMMRTDWSSEAMLVGLKCGPWLGHNLWRRAKWDYGAAHEHPDVNSFQVYAYGTWLAIDPGYTVQKRTCNHNTLLIDGVGQLGEGGTWFVTEDALEHEHYAKIVRAESCEQYDYVVGDATRAYHPGLGLSRFVRHWIFLKPSRTLVVVDDVAAEPSGYYKAWDRKAVKFEGMRVENPKREFLVPSRPDRTGKVWFTFDGPSGTYDVDINYFDNWPRVGRYKLVVAGKVVEEWVHNVETTDLHLRMVRNVRIEQGDRVELRGEPFGKPGKFIKMVLYNREAPRERPHEVALLLHVPADAKVRPVATDGADTARYLIDAGKAYLDVWAQGPALRCEAGRHRVAASRRIKSTQRIELRPQLQRRGDEDAATVVAVLQARKPAAKGLLNVQAEADPADRSVTVLVQDAARSWRLRVNLEGMQVRVEQEARHAAR